MLVGVGQRGSDDPGTHNGGDCVLVGHLGSLFFPGEQFGGA